MKKNLNEGTLTAFVDVCTLNLAMRNSAWQNIQVFHFLNNQCLVKYLCTLIIMSDMSRPIERLRNSSTEMTKALHCAIQAAVAHWNLLCHMSDGRAQMYLLCMTLVAFLLDSNGLSFRLDLFKLCEQEGCESHTDCSLPCDTHRIFS